MPATARYLINPFGAIAARPLGLSAWDLLGLPRVQAPPNLVESVIHAIRGVAADTESVNEDTSVDDNVAAADDVDGDDDPDAEPRKGPFDPGVVSMEELIREHSDAVYRVALSVTRDPVLAEDVSQDALIKAWQALPSFRGDSPLRNWILRITHNTAISTLRKRRDELRDPDQLPERLVLGSVESQVQDRLALGRFEEALADLDEVSRSIVVLREVEGLSYSELCDVLDLPMPTVKTRLLRARRQLAQALEGWQP